MWREKIYPDSPLYEAYAQVTTCSRVRFWVAREFTGSSGWNAKIPSRFSSLLHQIFYTLQKSLSALLQVKANIQNKQAGRVAFMFPQSSLPWLLVSKIPVSLFHGNNLVPPYCNWIHLSLISSQIGESPWADSEPFGISTKTQRVKSWPKCSQWQNYHWFHWGKISPKVVKWLCKVFS